MIDVAAAMSEEHLADFDWKLKVVMASSTASSIQKPLLHLVLFLKNVNGETREVLLELDREELETVLNSLSKIREAMQKIPQR
mmetsp:Transcript_77716/g.209488  ORF Transcript_77716/g.209488 Transcript_77716/m.209488 type:complete len:83 (-) Transcript_77716:44-292(-)